MFRKFVADEQGASRAQVKSSVQRSISKQINDMYPSLSSEALEELMPKKDSLTVVKCQDHINILLSNDKEPLFFNQREGPYFPTLKTLHKVGNVMHIVTVDVGAIKPLIGGAALMCPGIRKDVLGDIPADAPVQIMAEGKELPFAVGMMKMSSDEIKKLNTGIGVEILHTLGDGLWNTTKFD